MNFNEKKMYIKIVLISSVSQFVHKEVPILNLFHGIERRLYKKLIRSYSDV